MIPADSAPSRRSAFLLRKLHSLSGVVPVGIFLGAHLWTNATSLRGREAFDAAVGEIQTLPGLPAIEVFGILLPLAFHAVFGVVIALSAKSNVGRYPYARNWFFVMQRVSGFLSLVFVLAHLWEFRVQKAFFGLQATSFYDVLEAHLSSDIRGVPLVAVGYLVGLVASVFHFTNGLWGFCVSWGVVTSRTAQRRLALLSAGVGLVLVSLGWGTVVNFASGSAPYLTTISQQKQVGRPCPASSGDPKESKSLGEAKPPEPSR